MISDKEHIKNLELQLRTLSYSYDQLKDMYKKLVKRVNEHMDLVDEAIKKEAI